MIPFVDLKAQYAGIKEDVNAAIQRVLESCHFTLGPEVVAFEEEFARYCNTQYGVAVNSGTSALHLSLLASGVGPGDEVITVPFTFMATVSAIQYAGATPVFVDINPETYTLDVTRLEGAITKKTKAVIPVHLYGQSVDMDPLLAVARAHGLTVIEDAAQAHGAEYKGRRVGSMGHMACFSFYPGKNLGAYGEGGLIATNDAELTRTLRMLRDWGAEKKYEHVLKGYNYRMEALQGAVLRVKLPLLEEWTEARRAAAARYDRAFKGSGVRIPLVMPDTRHVYHIYAIRTSQRARWQQELQSKGVSTGIHYPTPIHLLPAFSDLGYSAGSFPHSERAANEALSLPMYPELSSQQIDEVVDAVLSCRG